LFGLFQSRAVSVHYCGNLPETQVADSLPVFGNKKPGPAFSAPDAPGISQNQIYLVHDKKARQSQIYFSAEGEVLKTEDEGKFALLNEYLGGGFSGLIVQEIREYRSLAYSTGGGFRRPAKKGAVPVFSAYVGCQSDKTAEALTTMMNILRKMPEFPERLPAFQNYYASSLSAKYPEFRNMSEYIENAKLRGNTESHLKHAYSQIRETSFADLLEFYRKNLQNKPVAITIYGNLSKLNRSELKAFGEIIELSPATIRTE
jgi:predicted Zn-dependent peptidase